MDLRLWHMCEPGLSLLLEGTMLYYFQMENISEVRFIQFYDQIYATIELQLYTQPSCCVQEHLKKIIIIVVLFVLTTNWEA